MPDFLDAVRVADDMTPKMTSHFGACMRYFGRSKATKFTAIAEERLLRPDDGYNDLECLEQTT